MFRGVHLWLDSLPPRPIPSGEATGCSAQDAGFSHAITVFKTKAGGIFEIARGTVTSTSENEIMAAFKRHKGASGQPMSRVTINRQQRTVNVLYHHPTDNKENKKEVFGVAKELHVAP